MTTSSKIKPFRERNVGTKAVQIGGYAAPVGKTAIMNGLRAKKNLNDAPDTIYFYILDKDGVTKSDLTPITTVLIGESFIVSGQEIKDCMADGESLWAVAGRDNAFTVHLYVTENG